MILVYNVFINGGYVSSTFQCIRKYDIYWIQVILVLSAKNAHYHTVSHFKKVKWCQLINLLLAWPSKQCNITQWLSKSFWKTRNVQRNKCVLMLKCLPLEMKKPINSAGRLSLDGRTFSILHQQQWIVVSGSSGSASHLTSGLFSLSFSFSLSRSLALFYNVPPQTDKRLIIFFFNLPTGQQLDESTLFPRHFKNCKTPTT